MQKLWTDLEGSRPPDPPGIVEVVFGFFVNPALASFFADSFGAEGLGFYEGMEAEGALWEPLGRVFQRADAPGSLLAILQEFAARSINLSKLESRPTKVSLGDYCFIIDLDGHVADELVADALRAVHAKQAGVKFLGSYPAAGEGGEAVREEVQRSWHAAEQWISGLRAQIAPARP